MFQLCFNLNKIHDSVGKALTANESHMNANSHQASPFDLSFTDLLDF
jgi:hypothetical protein